MNFKKSQSGRSMVEMLGVLAIIGVLSVGGIAGYSLAMRRHRANAVADIMTKYALVVYNKYQQELMDGTRSSSTSNHSINMPFKSAGVGDLPAGVSEISEYLTVISNEKTGIDAVQISARFDDDRLCKAVGSITGADVTGCNSTGLVVKIKQN